MKEQIVSKNVGRRVLVCTKIIKLELNSKNLSIQGKGEY